MVDGLDVSHLDTNLVDHARSLAPGYDSRAEFLTRLGWVRESRALDECGE